MTELIRNIVPGWLPDWEAHGFLASIVNWLKATALFRFLSFIYFYLVIVPYARFYLQGPWLGGYGCWNGLPPEEICARMNGASGPLTSHFLRNPAICLELIERDLAAKLVFLETLIFYPLAVYFLILWPIFRLCRRCKK